MNCEEVHQHFEAFIDDELSVNDADEFIRHIQTCSDCYDDLEVYYMALAATGELMESELDNYDLRRLLPDRIRECRKFVRRRYLLRFVMAAAVTVFVVALIYILYHFL